MQKLYENSLDKYNKSCSTLDQESNKIGFAFFCFFYNFLRILQVSDKHKYYLRNRFVKKSLKVLDSLRAGPYFALKTLERTGKTQLGPWGSWPAWLAKIGRLQRRPWPGRWGGGLGTLW
jgi:hypothetical protein